MSDLRSKLIRLAHENPELRSSILPILKKADAATCLKKVHDTYMEEHPSSKKKPTDKLFQDKCESVGGEGGDKEEKSDDSSDNVIQFPGGQKEEKPKTDVGEINTAPLKQPKEKTEKKKKGPMPKFEKVELPKDSDAYSEKLDRVKKESDMMESIHTKYEKHQAEDGSFPDDIKAKMNKEYSHGMSKLDKSDAEKDRKDLLETGANNEKAETKAHEDKLVAKAKKKYPKNKAQQSAFVEKGMKKHKAKKDLAKKRKDQGNVKTFLESYKKWKTLTKTWLNPESNPIINEFKQASANKVASRHQARRVASRYKG